jgi:2-polyprenyl-6-methoxyphenol hydroxylase-like FAD-dependent oxidoreductase
MSMQSLKVGIAGGSLGGVFAAVLLHEAGHDVTVYERSSHGLEGRGAGVVGQLDIFKILRMIGCEHVSRVGVVAHERIFLDRSGEIAARHRTPQTQISWDVLFRSFQERLPTDRYILDCQVVSAGECNGSAYLRLADGSTMHADLVVGADGLGSVVRTAVVGIAASPIYAGYVAYRGLYPETMLPDTAAKTLLDRFSFYDASGSHILGYLVPGADGSIQPGRRRYNWVWYRRVTESDGSLSRALTDASGMTHQFSLPAGAMPTEAKDDLIRNAERDLPPQFAAAVAAEQSPFIQGIFDYAVPKMAVSGIALLGDAAFVVRPHTAMGVAKAAGDAMLLKEVLAQAPDLVVALETYDAFRRPVGNDIAAYGRRLGASFG